MWGYTSNVWQSWQDFLADGKPSLNGIINIAVVVIIWVNQSQKKQASVNDSLIRNQALP